MSNRARSVLSNAITAVALGVVFMCLGASLCASAEESTKDPDRPSRDGKAPQIFRNGIGMTEVERMINLSARSCVPQIEIDGKPLRFRPCFIVDDLRAAFAKASESEPLLEFLEKNNFKCTKAAHGTRCSNTLKMIDMPRRLISGERLGPDFLDVLITDVAFKQATPAPLAPRDIKVTFTRLTRPFRD